MIPSVIRDVTITYKSDTVIVENKNSRIFKIIGSTLTSNMLITKKKTLTSNIHIQMIYIWHTFRFAFQSTNHKQKTYESFTGFFLKR